MGHRVNSIPLTGRIHSFSPHYLHICKRIAAFSKDFRKKFGRNFWASGKNLPEVLRARGLRAPRGIPAWPGWCAFYSTGTRMRTPMGIAPPQGPSWRLRPCAHDVWGNYPRLSRGQGSAYRRIRAPYIRKDPGWSGVREFVEPTIGIEPTTACLQDRGSTIELRWR